MTQFVSNAQDSETFSLYAGIRQAELNAQDWDREKSAHLAQNEGISLNDEHWAVITYLRNSYIEYGLPRYARTTARALNRQFYVEGGSKYLYGLFAGGPVTQGSQPANTGKRHRRFVWHQLLKNSDSVGTKSSLPPDTKEQPRSTSIVRHMPKQPHRIVSRRSRSVLLSEQKT